MNSYFYSSVAGTTLSSPIDIVEDSNSVSFLDVTTSPIRLIESPQKSQIISGILLDATTNQENYQLLLEISPKKNENPCDTSDTTDDIPETPKSVEIIDIITPKKASKNRSPLLPTQPAPMTCSAHMQQRSRTDCNGTLDNWINRLKPPSKPKPVNVNKYASWLNVTSDFAPGKLDPIAKANKKGKNAKRTVKGWCSSQISPISVTAYSQFRPTFPTYNSVELRNLTSNTTECQDKKITKCAQISPRLFSRSPTNQMSEGITKLSNSSTMLVPNRTVIYTSQKETNDENEGQLDNWSSVFEDSFLPLTPSPPKTLRKPKTLKQVSLATMLNRGNVATGYVVQESPHTRSLMKVVSSPTFYRNDMKYVDNNLTSRFADDGKVRRRKAERQLLHGFDCRCCADYYEALGLNQDERNKRVDQVSKHRDIAKEPSTPEYYWEIGMPNREEQRRRGQIIESNSPIALETRYPEYKRKRPARRRLSFSS